MTSDDDTGDKLRQLLTEAVKPITPKPGHEARFLARLRESQKSGRRVPAVLGWFGAGLSTAAIVVLAVLFVSGRHDSSSATSSAASGASTVSPAPPELPSPSPSSAAGERAPEAGPSRADLSAPAAANPQLNSDTAQKPGGDAGGTTGSVPKAALVPPDLDGDGIADTFELTGGKLVAQLSQAGQQTVSLPTLGTGAGVLGTTRLITADRTPVSVVFLRLSDSSGQTRDVIVALADGRLTVLRFGTKPAELIVDPTHGYACSDGELAVSGNPAPYVIAGAQLVASPRLRALLAVAGQASGC